MPSYLDAIGRIKQRPSELVLANTVTDDSGLYQCMARNKAGESWAAGRLMVNMSRFQPDPPQGLTCYVLSDSLVRLECKEPARSANNITAYTIHYFPTGGQALLFVHCASGSYSPMPVNTIIPRDNLV